MVLNTANKVVYSPHDYGNSVFNQPWFSDPNFPDNLTAKFDEFWGYIYGRRSRRSTLASSAAA